MTFQKNFIYLLILIAIFTFLGLSSNAQETMNGKATYYANKFHGRRTSDGSIYHRDSLTCAHRTLPFGTMLRVRNPKNDKEVIVKVNDRGPFRPGAILDLSLAAAKEIGIIQAGIAQVEVEKIGKDGIILEPRKFMLPELQLMDPATGEYHPLSEWAQRDESEREAAKAKEIQKQRAHLVAKLRQEPPRYKVLDTKMTAKGTPAAAAESSKEEK